MIKANYTIFKFYLTLMDSFSEYLSRKYTESSLENTDHYRTVIIQKIVFMFHTLEMLTNECQDGVSVRCVLRGILDNVATYCFIYQRDDENEIMFRHYLYALDGYKTYKQHVIDGIMEKEDDKQHYEEVCDTIIKQLEHQLQSHPYSEQKDENVEKIIKHANWKYESLQNPTPLKYGMIYKQIGFNDNMANYYQHYLPQFAHGLCLSNFPVNDIKQIKGVMYESIPIADKMIGAIFNTFPMDKEKMWNEAWHSGKITNMINQPDFNINHLSEFVRSFIKKDRTLLI